jgi:hypothetical protein
MNAIRGQKEAGKGVRPFGDPSSRIEFLLCLQQRLYPRVGYVVEKLPKNKHF